MKTKYWKWGVMTKHDGKYEIEFYRNKRTAKQLFKFFSKEIYPVLIKRKIRNDCMVTEIADKAKEEV